MTFLVTSHCSVVPSHVPHKVRHSTENVQVVFKTRNELNTRNQSGIAQDFCMAVLFRGNVQY
jgi:hypothetical protein